MTEEKRETFSSRTTNSLSLFSIITAVGTVFVLSTGVFDRASSSGAYAEKVLGLERSVTKIDTRLNEIDSAITALHRELSTAGVDVTKVQLITDSMALTMARLQNELDELKRSR